MTTGSDLIIDIACEIFAIDKNVLMSEKKTNDVYMVRMMLSAIFVNRKRYGYTKAGRILTRTHASIINQLKIHTSLLKYNETYFHNYNGFLHCLLTGCEFKPLKEQKPSAINGYEKLYLK